MRSNFCKGKAIHGERTLGVERLKRRFVSMQPFSQPTGVIWPCSIAQPILAFSRRLCRRGAEIDFENGETFVSVVGLLFLDVATLYGEQFVEICIFAT
jgi:hypothetical protein